jgi:GNAT superfamily N-acetyltransferase
MQLAFEIEPIAENHVVTNFDCGDSRLNDFIINDALQQKNDGWNTTYVATELNNKKVIGFFALKGDSISLTKETKEKLGKDYCDIPAIKIGRFAVDKNYQNKGIGRYIMKYAMGFIVQEICPLIGGIYITLDAYPHKVNWYKNHFKYRENTLIPCDGERFVNLIFPIKDFKTE